MQTFHFEDTEKEIDECGPGRKKENILIRVGRKKYKCIMLYLCLLVLLIQTAYLILEKADSRHINSILDKMPNITRSLKQLIRRMKNKTFEEILSAQVNEKQNLLAEAAVDSPPRINEYDTVN